MEKGLHVLIGISLICLALGCMGAEENLPQIPLRAFTGGAETPGAYKGVGYPQTYKVLYTLSKQTPEEWAGDDFVLEIADEKITRLAGTREGGDMYGSRRCNYTVSGAEAGSCECIIRTGTNEAASKCTKQDIASLRGALAHLTASNVLKGMYADGRGCFAGNVTTYIAGLSVCSPDDDPLALCGKNVTQTCNMAGGEFRGFELYTPEQAVTWLMIPAAP
jgi:hypothetical protein